LAALVKFGLATSAGSKPGLVPQIEAADESRKPRLDGGSTPSARVSQKEPKDDSAEQWANAVQAVDQQDWELARSVLKPIASKEAGPRAAESSELLKEIEQALSRRSTIRFLKTLSTDDLSEIDASKRPIPVRFTRDSLQRAWAILAKSELPAILADRRASAEAALAPTTPKSDSAGPKDDRRNLGEKSEHRLPDRGGYVDRTGFFSELREKLTVDVFLKEHPEATVVPADTDRRRRIATYDYSAFTFTFIDGTIAAKQFNWPLNLDRINELFDGYIAGLGPPDVTDCPNAGALKPRRFAMWTIKDRDVRCALTHYFDENLGDVLLIQAFCISQLDRAEAVAKPQR